MDMYGGIPRRLYLYVFKPFAKCVVGYELVNWTTLITETYWLQCLSLTLWRGNAYKVKYLAYLFM